MPKRRSKQASSSRGPRAATSKARARKGRAPRGQVGPQTYDQVRKLVEERKIPVGKAFAEVAAATGRKPGTVAVTYYRIARRHGGPIRKRRRAGTAARRAGRPRGNARVSGVLGRALAAIKELEEVIAHQAHEIGRLRRESKLAERIRKALRE